MAGTRKPTIARTAADKYSQKERLGASFFFSRGGGDVSHAGKFFASIAVQLANISDALNYYICEAIKKQRDIASKGLRHQWRRLVYEPLSKIEAQSLMSPLLLVVDALDECEGKDNVLLIVQLLAEARDLQNIQLRIFLTSRPKIPIRYGLYRVPDAAPQDFVLPIRQPHLAHLTGRCKLSHCWNSFAI
jgi:hypothetical protein